MATVTHQPGIRSQNTGYSGSVQYIGGSDGPYTGDEDVFLNSQQVGANELPIPMGLEVFERVSKLVAHQVVSDDQGELGLNECAISVLCYLKAADKKLVI